LEGFVYKVIHTQVGIHGYVSILDEVHFLATQSDGQLEAAVIEKRGQSLFISLGRRYVRHFNQAQRRSGTLWEGRYRATVIDGEQYLLTCLRYVEMNPVRAGMVASPADYPWSSHRVHADGAPSSLVTPHPLSLALGPTPGARQAACRALFRSDPDDAELTVIREATNKAWALGNDRFRDEVAQLTQRRVSPAPRGRPRKEEACDVA
jgi:putative transposase